MYTYCTDVSSQKPTVIQSCLRCSTHPFDKRPLGCTPAGAAEGKGVTSEARTEGESASATEAQHAQRGAMLKGQTSLNNSPEGVLNDAEAWQQPYTDAAGKHHNKTMATCTATHL